MSAEGLYAVVAVCGVAVAASLAVAAWALWRLAADARVAAREVRHLSVTLQEELPQTLDALGRAAASLEQLAGEGGARLVTLDALATEGEATLAAVRELSGSLNDIVRGPADTVTGVRRSARMMGEGLASGADRLRRAIVGGSEPPDDGRGLGRA